MQILDRAQGYDITYTHYNYPKQTYAERFSVLVDAADVPPMGFKGLTIRKTKAFTRFPSALRSGPRFIENDIPPRGRPAERRGRPDGQDDRDRVAGLHLFEDTGDVGDEYNYSYPKKDRRILSHRCQARIERIERGPLRVALKISVTMMVPAAAPRIAGGRSARRIPLTIATTISLSRTSHSLTFETVVVNDACDHRFRVFVPAGIATDTVLADSQFTVVERTQRTVQDKGVHHRASRCGRPDAAVRRRPGRRACDGGDDGWTAGVRVAAGREGNDRR